MKKTSKRQSNYRLRRTLKTTAGQLHDLLKEFPPETPIQEAYKLIFEQLILLEQNKGEQNVRKK